MKSQNSTGHRSGVRSVGWLLVAGAVVALVYIPAILTGESGPMPQAPPSAENLPVVWPFQIVDQLPVDGPFSVAPAYEVLSTNGTTASAYLLVGANGSGANQYRLGSAEDIPVTYGSDIGFRANLSTNAWSDDGIVSGLGGGCCTAHEGWVDGDLFHTALTFPGFNTQATSFEVEPPFTVFVSDFGAVLTISVWIEYTKNRVLASSYNTTQNAVNVFTQEVPGVWNNIAAVPMDSPFDGVHWGQASSHDGDKTWIVGRNGGPVQAVQIDSVTGDTDWTQQVDFLSTFPTGFVYQQAVLLEDIDLPDGSTGDALAILSPDDTSLDLSIIGAVGGTNPPAYFETIQFQGAVSDRQALFASGPMVYVHWPDPDGTGVLTSVVNANGLENLTAVTQEDDSRNMIFSGAFPDDVLIQGTKYPIHNVRPLLVETTPTNMTIGTLDLPGIRHDMEGGVLQWDNVVGKAP